MIEGSSAVSPPNNPLYRDQDRAIKDDPVIAEELFRRLRPHLPEGIYMLKLIGLNDRRPFLEGRPYAVGFTLSTVDRHTTDSIPAQSHPG